MTLTNTNTKSSYTCIYMVLTYFVLSWV